MQNEVIQNKKERSAIIKRIVRWGMVVLVFAVVVGGLIWIVQQPPTDNSGRLVESGATLEHTKGPKGALVRLVEYSDFQCPACRSYYPMVKALREEFPSDLEIVYRHFPLERIHANANAAGRAAEAAGTQGKFWEMHDRIFERQDEWSKVPDPTNLFAEYATSLGLDENRFRADMISREANNKVQQDLDSGIDSRVNSTPTFFLNGEKIQNPRNLDEFRALIQQSIAARSL
ncbi:MAG TPA: thioredoxin domain-containing protein [Candidatus Paceibacterota bacterium]